MKLSNLLKKVFSSKIKSSVPIKATEVSNGYIEFRDKDGNITMICSKEMLEDIKNYDNSK